MKAILLAAGLGTRLRPLTDYVPKCMLPINGRPLIEHWFQRLSDAGVEDILMNLHHLAPLMEKWLERSPFSNRIRTVYEKKILGTGGTLLKNKAFVEDDPVMLIHADNLCLADLAEFIDAHHHRPPGTDMTMMTFETPTPWTCGIVQTDSAGVVRSFYEKASSPPGFIANAAVYILEPEIVDFLETVKNPFVDFSTDVLPHYIGKMNTYYNAVYHRDIGNIDSLLEAQCEYSPAATDIFENDAWKLMCEGDNGILIVQMENALAAALDADRLDLKKKYRESVSSGRRWHLLPVAQSEDIPAIIDKIPPALYSQLVLFVKKGERHFSSRRLFAETGIRSLVMYSE